MAAGDRVVYIVFGPEFNRVIDALGDVDRKMRPRLRDAIKDAAEPLVARARSRALTIPVKHRGHTGLRRRVAQGVGIRASIDHEVGVRIFTSMPHRDEAGIPLGLDRPGGWRHPVFGHRSRWVTQHTGGHGWFTGTFQHSADDFFRANKSVLDAAAEEIDRAGDPTH